MARVKKQAPVDEATAKAMINADVFVRSGRERKTAETEYKGAKEALLDWLGLEPFRLLPDGRTVFKSCSEFPAAVINRSAYTATTVTIGPPPAPE